jgi:hypothetical protein
MPLPRPVNAPTGGRSIGDRHNLLLFNGEWLGFQTISNKYPRLTDDCGEMVGYSFDCLIEVISLDPFDGYTHPVIMRSRNGLVAEG